jgi:hypothetical protein
VGIITCDPDHIESGVYEAVCAALPFPVAGVTTTTQAVNGEFDVIILTVFVITSDDAHFSVGMTDEIALDNDALSPTRAVFERAVKELPSKPKLILVFPPMMAENSGDTCIDSFSELCPDVPVFGTLAVSDSVAFDNCSTLCNGAAARNKMAFILIAGNVSPRFLIASMDDNNKMPYNGEITKSKNNIVQEINGISAYEYFSNIGLASDGKLDEGLQFVPVLIDFKKRDDYDGIPVVRAIVYLSEKGEAICRGNMYQNSVFTIASPSADDVLQVSAEFADKIKAMPNRQVTMIFSCIVRRMTFAAEPMTEAAMIEEKLSGGPPFTFAYAGGEICPTSVRDGKAVNRFHNFSIVACIL